MENVGAVERSLHVYIFRDQKQGNPCKMPCEIEEAVLLDLRIRQIRKDWRIASK